MKIINTGIDIIEIERIRKAVDKNNKFLNKIFTNREKEYFMPKENNTSHIAGAFAAKEAVSKALGTGFCGVAWREIEIIRDSFGKPEVQLWGNAMDRALKAGIRKIHISISHSRDYAAAVAIAEGDEL